MIDRVARIEQRIVAVFGNDADLQIKDQSHLHAGHSGAKDGKGHYEVKLISPKFAGIGRIQRHKMVYDALGDLMESDIHAVRIKAQAPSE